VTAFLGRSSTQVRRISIIFDIDQLRKGQSRQTTHNKSPETAYPTCQMPPP
jgi:hypothetical protein